MPEADLERVFKRVIKAAKDARLPEVETAKWYGTPSLRVRGKSFTRLKDADTLVVLCPLEEKELLLEQVPDIYFETDHYKGWPAVLIRLGRIDAGELAVRLERAWRVKAPKKLIAERDGAR